MSQQRIHFMRTVDLGSTLNEIIDKARWGAVDHLNATELSALNDQLQELVNTLDGYVYNANEMLELDRDLS